MRSYFIYRHGIDSSIISHVIFYVLNSTQNRDKHGTLTKTVIVGESANTGEPDVWMKQTLPRSFPIAKTT